MSIIRRLADFDMIWHKAEGRAITKKGGGRERSFRIHENIVYV